MGKQIERILIIKPSSLGDIVHALPAARLIVRHIPDVVIDWVVTPAFAELVDYCPNLGRKIIFRRREMGRIKTFLPVFYHFLRDLRSEKYDAVIDLQGLLRSAIFSFCAKSELAFGPAKSREFGMSLCYNRHIAIPAGTMHAIERNLAMVAKAFGWDDRALDFSPLQVKESAASSARSLLNSCFAAADDTLFGIVPGANWPSKCWPEDFYAAYLREVAKLRPAWKFVFFGTAKELPMIVDIVKKSGLPPQKCLSLAGKTGVDVLAEALRLMKCVCGGDTGAIHLAAAVGTPTVSLYGSTRPALTGVRARSNLTLTPEIPCLGCLKRICPLPENLCYRGIDPVSAARQSVELCGDAVK